MQEVPTRYVSVSELYTTDEVELLLQEIRELEPTSCRGEDALDCEIAGSGAGAGGRSPVGTEHSWDSHAHYSRLPPPAPRPLAPLYCRLRHCLTTTGAFTLLIVLCSAGTCACIWAAVGLRPWLLPLSSRIRLLLLGALSSLMLHSVLMLMHITRLTMLLPLDWDKLAIWTSVWSVLSLWTGAGLTLHAVVLAPEYRWTQPHLANILYCASGLGVCGGCMSLGIVLMGVYFHCPRRPQSTRRAPRSSSQSLKATYRAVPAASVRTPSPPPQPSTSRDNPL